MIYGFILYLYYMRKIVISVNGKQEPFSSDKRAQDFIQDLIEAHKNHPYFFNLEKIKKAQFKEDNWNNLGDKHAAIMRRRKLEMERAKFLKDNPEIQKPEPLKIEIVKS